MLLQLDPSVPVSLEHRSSSGLNGEALGRARLLTADDPDNPTAADVLFSARRPGADGNAYYVTLIDLGRTTPATRVGFQGDTLEVFLRRSSSAILATAVEVAAAVNEIANRCPIVAYGLGEDPVVAMARTALSGGDDPVMISGGQARWDTDDKGGLFAFDHEEPLAVTQVEVTPSSSQAIVIKAIRYASCFPDAEDGYTLYSVTAASALWLPAAPYVLPPGWAITVAVGNGSIEGSARVTVRKFSRNSYL